MDALNVKGLAIAYHDKPVIEDVTFQIPTGKLVGVIGPNGAGKSTLLKGILELLPRITGEIAILGSSYEDMKSSLGYVPQRESVDWDFPTNALDVVMMGRYGHLGWFKRPGKKEKEIAMHCLEKVGLADFAKRQISQLSGGQQQRVFLARALAQEADLYLMDEPFAAVDAATERAIVILLNELKNQGKTVLVVHHDLSTVKEYFDWCVLINKQIISYGPTEETFTVENLQKTYGGSLTILDPSNSVIQAK